MKFLKLSCDGYKICDYIKYKSYILKEGIVCYI